MFCMGLKDSYDENLAVELYLYSIMLPGIILSILPDNELIKVI